MNADSTLGVLFGTLLRPPCGNLLRAPCGNLLHALCGNLLRARWGRQKKKRLPKIADMSVAPWLGWGVE